MAVREISQTFPDQNPRGSHRELNRAELIVERKKFQDKKSIELHRILNGRTSNAKRNSIRTLWNIISGHDSKVSRHWVLLVNKVNR